jgi:serine protease Do
LIGGAAISLATGHPAGAQVAQNDAAQIRSVVPRSGAPASFADLTEQLQPAVVNIATRQRIRVNASPFAGTPFADLFGQRDQQPQTREAQSLGSGFIISPDGYVVTNNHVITADGQGEVEEISITMTDGTEYPAELVSRDTQSDLAVLKIKRDKPFPFVEFGDSREARVGDWVIAIGNPFGLGGTVTSGIVSAVYRNTGPGAYDRYIQTDASINRGNSGGPLFDMSGRVIGINNAIFSPSGGSVGIGFAIPAEVAAPIVEKLRNGQAIERGYLGVRIQPVTDDLADSLGLPQNRGEFVQAVEPGEAADKAGLQAGDIVLGVNGQDVTADQTLSFLVANIEPGKRVPLVVMRDGKRMTIDITVGKRPSEEELATRQFDPDAQPGDGVAPSTDGILEDALGVQVIELTPQIASQLGAGTDTTGVVIVAVDPNSDAGRKGLRRGDIVMSVNYAAVASVDALAAAVHQAQDANREAVLLRIKQRGSPPVYVPIRLR